jgi:uncharacterized membrane protein
MSRFTDETITTTRLSSFSDGVFAIAVTLLVFNLKVPQIPAVNVHRDLPGFVGGMVHNFVTYILTFLLVASYWAFHHRMLNLLARIDNAFLWLNIYYLLAISFIPFPSALFGSYTHETFSFVFYVCSMILVNLLSMLLLAYASHKSRLIKKDIPMAFMKYLFIRQVASIIIFSLAILISFFHQRVAVYCIFAVFPANWTVRRYFSLYAKRENVEA